jgi:hypothetical protein
MRRTSRRFIDMVLFKGNPGSEPLGNSVGRSRSRRSLNQLSLSHCAHPSTRRHQEISLGAHCHWELDSSSVGVWRGDSTGSTQLLPAVVTNAP